MCLPGGLDATETESFALLARLKRRIAPGAAVIRAHDTLEAVYAVHGGSFKSIGLSRHGRGKVTGFYLPGEIIGLDAISTGRYLYDAIALEASEVCVIPYERLRHMAAATPALQHQLLRAMSAGITRDHGLMLLLCGMSAEQRVAAFLLSLSRRYRLLGYARDRFVLRMTREDIGSYLGLTLETVSRIATRLRHEGLIETQRREVHLIDAERLAEIAEA